MKNLSVKNVVALGFVSVLVSGCFQSNEVKSFNSKMDDYEKIEDRMNKRAQEKLDVAPSWYLKDSSSQMSDLTNGVYGVASHFSKDLDIAFDDATSLALGNAVHRAKLTINMVKQSVRAGSGENQRNVFNRMQEEIVKRTSVQGYKVEEREVRIERGGYRAFVKVFIPTEGLFSESEKNLIASQMKTMRSSIKNDDDQAARYDSANPSVSADYTAGAVEPVIEVIPLKPMKLN